MDNSIRQLREARALTQDELASILDVSRQTIISLERGRYDPSIRLAFKIAREFGLRIEDIFRDEGEHNNGNEN